MSRKYFIALAEAIAELGNTADRIRMAELVGAICADQNDHFDWTRWHMTSDRRQAGGGRAAGGRRPATGDRRPATGDRRPAAGDRRPATGDQNQHEDYNDYGEYHGTNSFSGYTGCSNNTETTNLLAWVE